MNMNSQQTTTSESLNKSPLLIVIMDLDSRYEKFINQAIEASNFHVVWLIKVAKDWNETANFLSTAFLDSNVFLYYADSQNQMFEIQETYRFQVRIVPGILCATNYTAWRIIILFPEKSSNQTS